MKNIGKKMGKCTVRQVVHSRKSGRESQNSRENKIDKIEGNLTRVKEGVENESHESAVIESHKLNIIENKEENDSKTEGKNDTFSKEIEDLNDKVLILIKKITFFH